MRHLDYYTPPGRWRPSFYSPYVINFSSFIKVKPLAHRGRRKSLVTTCAEYQSEKRWGGGFREEDRKTQTGGNGIMTEENMQYYVIKNRIMKTEI